VYDRIFGDFPAKNTVYTPYAYGSGQPYAEAIPGRMGLRPYHVSIKTLRHEASRARTQLSLRLCLQQPSGRRCAPC
jgi:hypothetical protein